MFQLVFWGLLWFSSLHETLAVCSDTSSCIRDGRLLRHTIDWHTGVADAEACCALCDAHIKCHYWSYRPNRGQCHLVDGSAVWKEAGFGWVSMMIPGALGEACPPVGSLPDFDLCEFADPSCDGVPPCPDACVKSCCIACDEEGVSRCCLADNSIVTRMSPNGPQQVRIDQLKVGDKVAAVDDFGKLTYQDMYFESHKYFRANDVTRFRRIWYGNEEQKQFIDITNDHLIYVTSNKLPPTNDHCIPGGVEKACVYPAGYVSVGDTIWVVDVENESHMTPRNVSKITSVEAKPRSPRVMNGNILVNGILASNHPKHHNTNEAIYSVLRAIYYVYPSILETEQFAITWKHEFIMNMRFAIRDLGAESGWFAEYGRWIIYVVYFIGAMILYGGVKKAFNLFVGNKTL